MKIAYIMLVHKNFDQINMNINKLIDEYNDVYIHVDTKNEDLYRYLEDKYREHEKVHIIKNRVHVNWSGFSVVRATLNLIEAVKESNKEYNYVNLLSGQCFPIKSNDEIREFLSKNKGSEFIEYRDITDSKSASFTLKRYNFFRERKNIRKLYVRIIDNIIRRLQRPFIYRNNFIGMRLYRGSQWFTISYDCMLYVLNYIEENPWIFKDFKYTLTPDEHFFQMLICNSPYKEKIVNNNLRYIDWSLGGNSPKVLTMTDLDMLTNSEKLWARKFDTQKDRELLYKLIEHTK